MLRYNGFSMSHKTMRAMMFHSLLQLKQVDFANRLAMHEILINLELVLKVFDEHADLEDQYILSLAALHNPQVMPQFEAEHTKDSILTKELAASIDQYKETVDEKGRLIAGNTLFYNFIAFIAFNLEHMNKEEICFNKAICALLRR